MSVGAAGAGIATGSGPGSGLGAVLDRIARIGADRSVLWATVLVAACLPWLAPRLPMIDLPQHAAQVALWRDLILGTSPWVDVVRINLMTPYLAGYGLALPLSFVMSAGTALSVILSLACLAFFAAAVGLRKETGADERLDWMSVTSFYGFAFIWGFFTFLVVAPVVLVFVRLAIRHARSSSFGSGTLLALTGLALLLSHGLAFLFACAVGGAVTLATVRSLRALVTAAVPYVALGLALVAFAVLSRGMGAPPGADFIMYGPNPIVRISTMLSNGHGYAGELVLISVAVLAAPFLMRLEPNARATAPLVVLGVVALVVPQLAFGTGFLFERFGMFTMPFIAAVLMRPANDTEGDSLRTRGAVALMVLAAWASIALLGARNIAFMRESADFERVLAAAEPGKRAMAIIADLESPAARHPLTYVHHAAWYQADKQGLVDFNFANFHPQVVRFRPEHAPAAGFGFEWSSAKVDWVKHRGRMYDYFFVRHGALPIPQQLIENGECRLETIAAAGAWTLLKRGACSG